MCELTQEIDAALTLPLGGRQWAKSLFWDVLSFDRIMAPVPFEVLPKKNRIGVAESRIWAQLGDIRVVLFQSESGIWSGDQLESIACKVGLIWRESVMLFTDVSERLWTLVVCVPRIEGKAGVSRRLEMSEVARDRRLKGVIEKLSPEIETSPSRSLQELWLAGRPMQDVVTRMEHQLRRSTRRQVKQGGFLEFIRPYAMHPLLRQHEEHGLGKQIQDGNRDAWRELVEHNVRMGFWGANRSSWPKVDFDERFQYSMMGIMRAAEKFDPDQGTRFSTYAFAWMRQVCQREYQKNRSTVYLPDYKHSPLRSYIEKSRRQPYREEPWTDEDWEYERIVRLTSLDHYDWAVSPVHQEACEDIDPAKILQVRHDGDKYMGAVLSILAEYSERDQDILFRRFGIYYRNESTLQEIGEFYGLTREAVRQVQKRLLEKLSYLIPIRFPQMFGDFKELGLIVSDEIDDSELESPAVS